MYMDNWLFRLWFSCSLHSSPLHGHMHCAIHPWIFTTSRTTANVKKVWLWLLRILNTWQGSVDATDLVFSCWTATLSCSLPTWTVRFFLQLWVRSMRALTKLSICSTPWGPHQPSTHPLHIILHIYTPFHLEGLGSCTIWIKSISKHFQNPFMWMLMWSMFQSLIHFKRFLNYILTLESSAAGMESVKTLMLWN